MKEKEILDYLLILENNWNSAEAERLYNFIFGFDELNNPNVINGEVIYRALELSKKYKNINNDTMIYNRIFKDADKRYNEIIKPLMLEISSTTFYMGSDENNKLAYCGETPKHEVTLDKFMISSIPITRDIYKQFNPFIEVNNEKMPITNVTWYDAYIFALWVGCRLPTESEWEYASGKNENSEWCCDEDELINYGWYSENSKGFIHNVGLLKPNKFGLYDMHGNVWEWVLDFYDDEFYKGSNIYNPKNQEDNGYHVCRGGTIQGFSEMCRCSFRYYEPSDYKAVDLGFRIVKEF